MQVQSASDQVNRTEYCHLIISTPELTDTIPTTPTIIITESNTNQNQNQIQDMNSLETERDTSVKTETSKKMLTTTEAITITTSTISITTPDASNDVDVKPTTPTSNITVMISTSSSAATNCFEVIPTASLKEKISSSNLSTATLTTTSMLYCCRTTAVCICDFCIKSKYKYIL